MRLNKIKSLCFLNFRYVTKILFFVSVAVHAEEIKQPYQVPTFTGESIDFHEIKPVPNPAKTVDADLIVKTVNACYPVPEMNLDVSLKVGTNYRPNNANAIQTVDSANYSLALSRRCRCIQVLKSTKNKN